MLAGKACHIFRFLALQKVLFVFPEFPDIRNQLSYISLNVFELAIACDLKVHSQGHSYQ